MKKILTFCFLLFAFNVNAMEKETTFKKELFDKAQSEGKVVIVSSWIKYCYSCASQMKVLKEAKKDFDNIELFNQKFSKLDELLKNSELFTFLNIIFPLYSDKFSYKTEAEVFTKPPNNFPSAFFKLIESLFKFINNSKSAI